MTPEQQLAIRAELARQMGWKLAHDGYGLSPDYQIVPQPRALPDPFTSAKDKDALVAWLAADDARWLAFRKELLLCWVALPDDIVLGHGYYERWLLTLPLETITLAAARALGIPEASEAATDTRASVPSL